MNAIYKIHNLTKVYDGRLVLDIESLEIQQGEIFALVGPSGSGKSTFLRLLNFLEPPTGGVIAFCGQNYQRGSEVPLEVRRQVTTVFQRPVLLSRSVWENVTYGLRVRGKRRSNGTAHSTLDKVGLSEYASKRAITLSGGEAQRAALARALIIRPDVLLLDEPTANLDPYNIKLIEKIVKKTNQEENTTVILVTHNIYQAKRMAQRVGLILEGKLIEVSDVETFFNAPKDPRTDTFVSGDMVY